MAKKRDITETYRLEKSAQKKILDYLNLFSGHSFDKIQTGTHGRSGGISDLIGTVDGRSVYIEVKSSTGKPSALQIIFLRDKKACGALAGIARSIQDALDICEGGFGVAFENEGWVNDNKA